MLQTSNYHVLVSDLKVPKKSCCLTFEGCYFQLVDFAKKLQDFLLVRRANTNRYHLVQSQKRQDFRNIGGNTVKITKACVHIHKDETM